MNKQSNKNFFHPLFLTRLFLIIFVAVAFSFCDSGKKAEEFNGDKPITPKAEYTKEEPREWEGMEDQLVPQITFNKGFGRDIIIRVNLENPGGDNYIEKIGIMDKDGNELVVKVFSRHNKFFEAHFFSSDLPTDKKDLRAFSKSSLYDLWTAPLKF